MLIYMMEPCKIELTSDTDAPVLFALPVRPILRMNPAGSSGMSKLTTLKKLKIMVNHVSLKLQL